MDKTLVTMEMFEKYHELLVQYIDARDSLILEGKATCPNCREELTSFKCENCGRNFEKPKLENLLDEN